MARRAAHAAEFMKLAPAQRGAWIRLLAAQRQVVQRLDEALQKEHALSLSEWDALVHLPAPPEGARMGDLAQRLLLSPSGLTRMMMRLEERGLVERRRGETDARETYTHITKKGLDLLGEAAPTHNEELRAHFLDALTLDECGELSRLLEKVLVAPARCARHGDA